MMERTEKLNFLKKYVAGKARISALFPTKLSIYIRTAINGGNVRRINDRPCTFEEFEEGLRKEIAFGNVKIKVTRV